MVPGPARRPHCPSSPATPGGPCCPALCPVQAETDLSPHLPCPCLHQGPCVFHLSLSLCLLSPVPLCFPSLLSLVPQQSSAPPPSISPSLLSPFIPPFLSVPPSSALPSSAPESLFLLCLSPVLFKLQVFLLCPVLPALPLLGDSRLTVCGLRQHRALGARGRGGQKERPRRVLVAQALGAGASGHSTPSSATCQGSLGTMGIRTSSSALHGQAQGPLMLGTVICLDSL